MDVLDVLLLFSGSFQAVILPIVLPKSVDR
jgi:hypothetical protein